MPTHVCVRSDVCPYWSIYALLFHLQNQITCTLCECLGVRVCMYDICACMYVYIDMFAFLVNMYVTTRIQTYICYIQIYPQPDTQVLPSAT